MPNSYTQIHLHIVFVVKYRQALIRRDWKDELYKYITGIVSECGHKMLQINGVEDHVHMLVGYKPVQSLSDLMKKVKANSSRWINDRQLVRGRFEWQGGYGAFSYSTSELPNVINYIKNQEEHHRKKSFFDEYQRLLDNFEVDYDEKYLFKDLE